MFYFQMKVKSNASRRVDGYFAAKRKEREKKKVNRKSDLKFCVLSAIASYEEGKLKKKRLIRRLLSKKTVYGS